MPRRLLARRRRGLRVRRRDERRHLLRRLLRGGCQRNDGQFALPTFQTPGGTVTQLWNLEYSGTHNGNIHLTFAYNPALLPAGFDESQLVIYHYHGAAWEKLTGTVDAVNHKITVTTASLSPFALGVVPSIAA